MGQNINKESCVGYTFKQLMSMPVEEINMVKPTTTHIQNALRTCRSSADEVNIIRNQKFADDKGSM